LHVQGHSLSSHLTDEQKAEIKAYMSFVESVFVNAVVRGTVWLNEYFVSVLLVYLASVAQWVGRLIAVKKSRT